MGVRFQEAGKIYYFTSAGYDAIEPGEYVIVETVGGLELARVVIAPGQVLNAELTEPLKPITRLATDTDLELAQRLKRRANEDVEQAKRHTRETRLQMKIISGSYNLDGSKLTLYFSSEGRIDFRDLVRDLSSRFQAQVQLRQVGPRDQAKLVGGYGRCGRRLCCSSWLTGFPAISIKMAKEQDLPLNPSKISGQCGRLLCCLSYENDMYRQVKQALPRPGTYLSTPSGTARVHSVNVPREVVTLQMTETFQMVDIPVQDLGLDRGVVRVLEGPPVSAPHPVQVRPLLAAQPAKPAGPVPGPAPAPSREPASGTAPPAPVRGFGPRRAGPRPSSGSDRRLRGGSPARARTPAAEMLPPSAPTPAADPAEKLNRTRRRRRRGGIGPGAQSQGT
ncbi:MAG: regulatory iron-sulfur-containing complex subunit RicT [Dehalococcoidia bacterium]